MIALAALLAAALATIAVLLLRLRDLRAQLGGQAALRQQAADSFAALSQKALQASNEQFLQLARESLGAFTAKASGDIDRQKQAIGELVRPVRESLEKVEGRIQQLDNGRAALSHQVSSLLAETSNLSKALRAPAVRGRWGEIQLRRVVELAGMVEHCDFAEQHTLQGAGCDAARLRPDLVVKLPDGKRLVVDAKAPLQAYLDALEARDEPARRAHLAAHARQLRNHVAQLAKKSYWDQVGSPQFVVLFVPNEAVFAAAMEQDPQLMEGAVAENVLLASPTTLIALLRAAAFGWRQERLARDAQEIASLGRELHKRLGRLAEHFARVGKSLGGAVAAYNDAVGSFEHMVVPGARKLREKAAPMDEELAPLPDVDAAPRALQAQEVNLPDDAN